MERRRGSWRGWALPPLPLPYAVRVALLAASVGLVGFVVLILAWGRGQAPVRDVWLYALVQWTAALVVLARGVAVRCERFAWLAVAAGLAAAAAGDVVYSTVVATADPVPYPSVADILYLAYYPGCLLGVGLLLWARIRRLPPSLWLDGLVNGLAVAAAMAAVVFAPIARAATGSFDVVVVGLAYPLADLLLLSLAGAILALFGGRAERRPWLVGLAFLLAGAGDLLYSLQSAAGTYEEGTWLDILWPAASLLLAYAAWSRVPPSRHREPPGRALLVTPVVCLLVAVGVLAVGTARPLPLLAVVLAVAALLGVVARLGLTISETRRLITSEVLAATDELTGLANRRSLTTALAEAEADPAPRALLLVDLDRFKEINDTLGHSVGDELLRLTAARLMRATRAGDLLARLGGDEFAVLCQAGTTLAAGSAIAERLVAALDAPFTLDHAAVAVRASVGVAAAPDHADTPALLLQRADVAMYAAKARDERISVYDPSADPHSRDRLELIEQLRRGIPQGELVCHYQPKLDLASGEIVGAEALVRWDHAVRGALSPAEFVPLAESHGLVRAITRAVLAIAVEQTRTWRAQGRPLPIAVNLAVSDLLDLDLPGRIAELLARHRVPASDLHLEITERVLIADMARVLGIVQRLRDLGLGVSIDDYGTGYAGVQYLHQLPVTELKLDRSVVRPVAHDRRAAAIVRRTVQLAHDLGLTVVAEGVEDAATAAVLAGFGCDTAQGYHYSRPLPAAEFDAWRTRCRAGDLDGARVVS